MTWSSYFYLVIALHLGDLTHWWCVSGGNSHIKPGPTFHHFCHILYFCKCTTGKILPSFSFLILKQHVNSGYLLNRAFSPCWLLPQWWTFAGFSQYSSSNSWWRVWAWVVLVDVWWSFHRFVVMLVRIKMAMVAIDHDYLMMIHKQWLQWLLDIIHQTFWSQLWLMDDDWWNQACGVGSFMMQMTITRQKLVRFPNWLISLPEVVVGEPD